MITTKRASEEEKKVYRVVLTWPERTEANRGEWRVRAITANAAAKAATLAAAEHEDLHRLAFSVESVAEVD